MSNGFPKFLWLISGIILIFAGVAAIFNPAATILSIAFILGLAMLISGIFEIVIFAVTHDEIFGAGWVLTDGILTVLLSILLLCNQYVTAIAIPYIFAIWVMFTGTSRTIASFDLKKVHMSGWGWMTLLGILGIVLGFASFFFPELASGIIGILVGIFLIVQGAISVATWWVATRNPFDK